MTTSVSLEENVPDEVSLRLHTAVEAALRAGRHTLSYFRQSRLRVDWKADNTPVTVADREAEELLREAIGKRFPDDGILGEEFEEQAGTSGYRWILDPIDGTKSFIHGVPLYGVLVGIEREWEAVAGVLALPATSELLYAAVGGGSWHTVDDAEPQRAKVSDGSTLDRALFCSASVNGFDDQGRLAAFEQLRKAVWLHRTWGDCYGYAMVATGRAEVMIDPIMNIWDCAALKPILEEAGGTFTDWQGNPTIYGDEAVATNGRLFEQIMAITRKA